MRFRITWRDGAYKVNVPEYEGGKVVTLDEYQRLRKALESVCNVGDRAAVLTAREALDATPFAEDQS